MICLGLFLLGCLATLGWSPLGQIWITGLAFTALVVNIAKTTGPWQAFFHCFCFALGLHAAGHGWVFSALYDQTDAGLLWSLVGSALFLIYLSTFLAVPAAGCTWLSLKVKSRTKNTNDSNPDLWRWPIALALTWTGAEALRGMLFNGFDSLAAGYLFSAWPLRGWVPVLGVYGCSLLFYASSAMVGAASVSASGSIRWRATVGCILVSVVLGGGTLLDAMEWVHPVGTPLSFRLIQGGVPQKIKFDANAQERQIVAYTETIIAAPADLIVTPETAFPIGLTEVSPAHLAKMRAFSYATASNIFLGTPQGDAQGSVRNSMFHIVPGRSELPRYDKTRLMPFGEYAPAGFGWFTQRMSVALNDQTAGSSNQAPFAMRTQNSAVHIGVLICHEDLSYADARRRASTSNVLINPGNLAWFEGSLALPQRLQIARIRALETGRPLLRTTNTGITAHLDAKGNVVSQLPSDTPGVLSGTIQPTAGLTPFARFGNLLAIGLAVVLLLATLVASKQWRP